MRFYDKLMYLIDKRGISRNKMVTDLGLNKNSTQNWQKQGTKPRSETMALIAEYFGVTAESLSDDDMELVYQPSAKKSSATKLLSFYQRSLSLRGKYIINDTKLGQIASLLNASTIFLTDLSISEYDPDRHTPDNRGSFKYSTMWEIFDLSDRCADDETVKKIMIQISRVILYRVKNSGRGAFNLYECDALVKDKLDYLYTNKPAVNIALNFGLNFSEIVAIHEYTGLSYIYLFSGEDKEDSYFNDILSENEALRARIAELESKKA